MSAALVAGLSAVGVFASAAPASASPWWTTNCTELHKKFPHGVGRAHAHDHTTGTPVTSFKHSNRLYTLATNANGQLDADHDHIACEAA